MYISKYSRKQIIKMEIMFVCGYLDSTTITVTGPVNFLKSKYRFLLLGKMGENLCIVGSGLTL
jgi:hypothetical protein